MENLIMVTHDGVFHPDDFFAGAILRRVFPGCRIDRTRDPIRIASANIAFDVGGKCDDVKYFDHHQPGGAGKYSNGVPFASCGLLWRKFGSEYATSVVKGHDLEPQVLANRVTPALIQAIDAADNHALVDGRYFLKSEENKRPPHIHVPSVSEVLFMLNPHEPADHNPDFDARYEALIPFGIRILDSYVLNEAALLLTPKIVRQSDTGTPILVLDSSCPWQTTVVNHMPHVTFVVYPGFNNTWKLQCVPTKQRDTLRRLLPQKWAGLEHKELAKLTGVTDATFCHMGRHIAGALSKNGAIALAQLALLPQS
jgi:uncharacterized UPF0160 family protein